MQPPRFFGRESFRAYCEDCGGVATKEYLRSGPADYRRKWYRPPSPGDLACTHARATTPISAVSTPGGCAFLSFRRIVVHPDRYCPDCGAWREMQTNRWIPVGAQKEVA